MPKTITTTARINFNRTHSNKLNHRNLDDQKKHKTIKIINTNEKFVT